MIFQRLNDFLFVSEHFLLNDYVYDKDDFTSFFIYFHSRCLTKEIQRVGQQDNLYERQAGNDPWPGHQKT